MRIKHLSVIVGFFIVSFAVVSCLRSDDPIEYAIDDTIYAFELDSIYNPSLKRNVSYKFTIDNIGRRIFNADSVPFSADTIINKILVTKLTSGSNIVYTGDTAFVMSDSVNFLNSMTEPLKFKVYSLDLSVNREYAVQVNRHLQDPDSLVWRRKTTSFTGGILADGTPHKAIRFGDEVRVYYSPHEHYYTPVADGVNWTKRVSAGASLPTDVILSSLLVHNNKMYALAPAGDVYASADGTNWEKSPLSGRVAALVASTPAGLAAVVGNENNTNHFAVTNDDLTAWEFGEAAPADFPTQNISSVAYAASTGLLQKHVIVGATHDGATQTVPWFSFDGKEWAALATTGGYYIPPMQHPNIMRQDDNFYVYGDDYATFYTSQTGIIWKEVEEKVMFPKEFNKRSTASTLVDESGYIWMMWSKRDGTSGAYSDEVWTGRVNKLGFVRK